MSASTPVVSENAVLYRNHRLQYIRYGSGEKILLAFHGFGQTKEVYEPLARALNGTHTVYSFDLFFHGGSRWATLNEALALNDWTAILRTFLQQEGIGSFSVAGFSLGGRFALATIASAPDRVEELWLIAPDGISPKFWYRFATRNTWTRRLFRWTATHPQAFARFATMVQSLRLVHPKLVRFAQSQVATPEKQYQLYHTWVHARQLRFRMPELAKRINQYGMRTRIFLGKYDRLFRPPDIAPLARRLRQCEIISLECGHGPLIEWVAGYFRRSSGR